MRPKTTVQEDQDMYGNATITAPRAFTPVCSGWSAMPASLAFGLDEQKRGHWDRWRT